MTNEPKTPRRDFLGKLAAGAGTSLALPTLLASINAEASPLSVPPADADEWFKKVKGKHKIIFDATEPNGGFAVIWSWVFYKTNNATGTPDNELTSVVVLRHGAIPLALEDKLWEKYKLGEVFKITDGTTSAPAIRNPFNTPTEPVMVNMGMDGIKGLTARGVMFCVCDVALTVYSGVVAKSISGNAEEIKKEWLAGLLPGVQVVPSGVWAVGRAQEKGCAYAYAGG
jgi:intracellular sulfur oxidation DsrE/DsrF family protein